MGRLATLVLPLAFVICFCPDSAYAQFGNVAGIVRDASGAALPGVTVEVTSPALIEKVRSTVTDSTGRYQIVNLPVGVYKVTFSLASFSTLERGNIELTTDFTAPVDAEMKVGGVKEVVTVVAEPPTVDVQNARQRQVFTSAEIRDLPTSRTVDGILNLVPGINMGFSGTGTNSVPTICSGGVANSDGAAAGTSGGRSGCNPTTSVFNAHTSGSDTEGLNQSRVQVDGLNVQGVVGSVTTAYIADVANAQEVSFTLSGSLGESETGGTTINIVPRTGGNRYSGQYFTSYSQGSFFGKNNKTRNSAFFNQMDYDYDVNGAYGGPVVRDRLWFYGVARQQGRQNITQDAYRNLNEGIFGKNYQGDPTRPVWQNEVYRNANMRLTLQASHKNKFNIFWDEQYTCSNPCEGTFGAVISAEASSTSIQYPVHLAQVTWNNPLTNRILFDAAVSWYATHADQTRNRFLPEYNNIPRLVESGATTPRGAGITSGSINNAFFGNNDHIQTRGSISFITGSHNLKVGYHGTNIHQELRPGFNDLRMQYYYQTPATTCTAGPAPPATGTWCGLNPFNSADPLNTLRVPIPTSVAQYIPQTQDQRVWDTGIYAQDQWTMNRFTFSGAIRYDNSQSHFGKTCVGPDVWLPNQWCINDPELGDGQGVNFHDITPRWGVTWDVFGNGKTSLKWNMGKYLGGTGITGIYTAPNVGLRTINTYRRAWTDLNGNRIVDCDLSVPLVAPASDSFPSNGECGARVDDPLSTLDNNNTARRFGRSPDELDELGQAVDLATTQCGRADSTRIPQAALDYCAAYGDSLIEGWSKRRYEWQLGVGIQHELLPRFSMEVTYNRRWYGNQQLTDAVGEGCDLYNSPVDPDVCIDQLLGYHSDIYDFYGVRAPLDKRLPGGGGYLMRGYADRKVDVIPANSATEAVILADGRLKDVWQGVDTNFTLRAKGGLRLSGGTSTGARFFNNCRAQVDNPPVVNTVLGGPETVCDRDRPYQTNLRGSAAYTIPWVDVLLSTVFTYRPGVQINANYNFPISEIVWLDGSEYRVGNPNGCPAGNAGCLMSNTAATTVSQNLLGSSVANDTYGEGLRLFDIKLAKNIRFANKRANVGVDVYNVFNSDGATGYCGTYPECAATATRPIIPWRTVTNITTPRFVRFQVQFDF